MIFWMDPQYRPAEPKSDVELYRKLIDLEPTADFHAKQGRSTGRYVLQTTKGELSVYVKKYYRLPWWQRWFSSAENYPGPLERVNIERAMALGIRVAEPVAAGSAPEHPCKSLLVLKSLEGYVALHQYLPARWKQTLARQDKPDWLGFKRSLIRRMATMVRNLHAMDLYHRDLYLCHFFLRETPEDPDGFDLVLIDWGRLKRSTRLRWKVKDLAQLLFSARLPGITQTDALRFAYAYFDIQQRQELSPGLVKQIVSKAAGYHRHETRSLTRKAA